MSEESKRRKNLREAIEDAFYDMGGIDDLKAWVAQSTVNKRIFYKDILTKVIPKQVDAEISGKDGKPIVFQWANAPGGPEYTQGNDHPTEAIKTLAPELLNTPDLTRE